MIDHLAHEWPRYLAIAEVGILMAAFIGLHAGSRAVLPKVIYIAGWGVLYVLAAVAVAIVVNVTSPVPPTPGVKALCGALAPVALGAVGLVVWTIRTNRRG